MPAVVGSNWNLPNFIGELYTASPTNTPMLSLVGGAGRGKITKNFDFPTAVQYNLRAPAQTVVSEAASVAAPAPTSIARAQVINTTQIHQESIRVTYTKMASMDRMTGLNTLNETPSVSDELQFQVVQHLRQMANDIEFSFVQGVYLPAANSATVATTRGMVAACALAGGTNINAGGAALDLPMMQNLFLNMFNAGAQFEDVILYVPGVYKQQLSNIYGFAPADRVVGGVSIQQIQTDFGTVGVVPSRYAPANTVLAVDMSVVEPVYQEIPGKGILFYEPLAKVGASETGQLYGHVGLDHGPAFAHGVVTNIA